MPSTAGVLHWLPCNVDGWFHIQRHPHPLMHPLSKPGLQLWEDRQSVLLESSTAEGNQPLLTTSAPCRSFRATQEGIRAKNEVTLDFWAARSPLSRSLQQLLMHRFNSPAHQGKGLSTRPATGTSVKQWLNGENRNNTGNKGSTPNCLGLKS